jgi:hypothetical protein
VRPPLRNAPVGQHALSRKRGGRGREIAYRCPLHDDHDPSLLVDPKEGVWHCFPCGVGGDVVTLYQLVGGYPKDGQGAATAAGFLLQEFGHPLPERPSSWFAKNKRQKPMRDLVHEAKVEVLTRRLWRYLIKPLVMEIEDEHERMEAARKMWNATEFRARQMIAAKGGRCA